MLYCRHRSWGGEEGMMFVGPTSIAANFFGQEEPPPYVNMSCIIHTSMRLRSTMVPSIISHMWWPSNHYYPPSNQHPSPSILPLSTAYLPLHTPPPHQLSHHAQPSIHYPSAEGFIQHPSSNTLPLSTPYPYDLIAPVT